MKHKEFDILEFYERLRVMQRIIDFVSGKLTYSEFETLFTEDPSIWDIAQSLLTPEIMNDKDHVFWSKSNRSRLESNNYSVQYACLSFGYDIVGRVVTHRMLGELVTYQYPDIVLCEPPELSVNDLRDKLGMEYLGGTEVDSLIEDVLSKRNDGISISKFVNLAKQELRTMFHLVPRKFPHWVQEPEWPMGIKSPMEFCSQNREGEHICFVFRDVDTQETKIVEQFF